MSVEIAPSILAANKEKIEEEVALAFSSGATYIHIDVMDGEFVPAKTFSPAYVKRVCQATPGGMIKDVHLMCLHPYGAIMSYLQSGGDLYTFHLEACEDEKEVRECISLLHSQKKKAGLSIKPGTDVKSLLPYLKDLDLVLVMSVEPGKGGQSFLPSSLSKIAFLKEEKEKNAYSYEIEVDGGINEDTAKEAINAGASVLVAGSYLYGHEGFAERLGRIRK